MKKSDLKELIRNNIIKELEGTPINPYRDPKTFEKEYKEQSKLYSIRPELDEIPLADLMDTSDYYDEMFPEDQMNINPEADEIDYEDLEAAGEFYDNIKSRIREIILSELDEAKKDKEEPSSEEDVEVTADEEPASEEPSSEEPAANTSSSENSGLSDSDQEYLNTLEDLKNKAKEMGDEKLENQIDNTITYFTRQHVVKEGDKSLMENYERRRLQVIAGIIK